MVRQHMRVGPRPSRFRHLQQRLLLACGGPEPAPYTDCDPLVPELCALPWPSAQHIEGSEADGWTLDLGPETLPPHVEKGPVDPASWNRRDGFSLHAPMIAWFDDLDGADLPRDGGESLEDDSPVVVVERMCLISPSVLISSSSG